MWEQCWLGDTPWRRPLLFWPRRSDLVWRCAQLEGLHSGGNERGQDKRGWQHWPGKHLGMVWTVRGTSKYSGECRILDQLFSNSVFLGLSWRVCYANILLDPTAIDSKSGGFWITEKQLQIGEGCKNWRRRKKDNNIVWGRRSSHHITVRIMNLCLSLSVSLTLILLLLSRFSHVQLFATLRDFPGKNTRVDCHALLQEIFPTQGSNLHLMSPALAGRFFTTSASWEALISFNLLLLIYCSYKSFWKYMTLSRVIKWANGFGNPRKTLAPQNLFQSSDQLRSKIPILDPSMDAFRPFPIILFQDPVLMSLFSGSPSWSSS